MPRALAKRRKQRQQRKQRRRNKKQRTAKTTVIVKRGPGAYRSGRPKRHAKKPPTTTAIIKAPAQLLPPPTAIRKGRERQLTGEEIALLKRTVAKGTSDDEFALFLWVCRKHKVDPVIGQIHCTKFWLKKHHKEMKPTQDGTGEIEVWIAGYQMVIMMGINGYRSIAARNHRDYGGNDDPSFTWFDDKRKTPAGKLVPESCTIKLWKKGLEHPVMATVYWEEFAPFNLIDERGDFWNRMPKHKLSIVAESHALRRGYPDLADIYTDEEMDQKLQDYTEGGRLLVEADGRTPSGEPARPDVQTWRAQQGVIDAEVERQKAGGYPSTIETMRGAPVESVPEAAWKRESDKKADMPPIDVKASQAVPKAVPVPPLQFKGTVEIDYSNEAWPIVRGDIAEILELLKAACPTMDWGQDSWWHVMPRDIEPLKVKCAELGYKVTEILPKKVSGVEKGHATPEKPTAERGRGGTESPAAPAVVSGTIEKSIAGMVGTTPVRDVTLLLPDKTKPTYRCWDKKWFEALDAGVGKLAKLILKQNKQYLNVVGALKIGSREWSEDGVPAVQRSQQEAGQRTLY